MLFSPIQLASLNLPNRLIIPPMCQYAAVDGMAQDWHLMHYGTLAFSGAGLLIVEATAVTPEGRISPADLGLWSHDTQAAFGRMFESIRKYSAMPLGVQLAHAGRKASTDLPWRGGQGLTPKQGGWQTVAPSPLAFEEQDQTPLALDKEGIKRIITAFADAARRAGELGFDCVEVHAAHGYLLHQFLSPLSNTRDDAYGGPLENRMRLTLEVFEAVRSSFPANRAVGVRISATDWVPGGWDVEQSVSLSKALEDRGCAYIHVSSGGLSPLQAIAVKPGYQVPFASRIKETTTLPVIAVGLITEAEQADTILASGQADMVAVGRGMLYDPRWGWHAAATLGAQVDAPPQFWRSAPHGIKGLFRQPA